MTMRRICVVTGTRADYGLLYWLLYELRASPDIDLQLIVTGMHLSPEFGNTWRVIEADGFSITAKVEMLLSGDSPIAVAKSIGLATIGFADQFDRLQPQILVLLGDRYEILAAAQAAMVARIPIAHIHGGEATEGLIDEAIRHSLTKIAHLHFASTEQHRARIIQMGEAPERVFNVGATGLDNIRRLKLLDRAELGARLGIELRSPLISFTYHPVTLSAQDPIEPMTQLLQALNEFSSGTVIFSKSNSDTNGRVINQAIDSYVAGRSHNSRAFASLGQQLYLSLLANADLILGNSSSGIIEAPAIGTPTVNVGDRQLGRVRSPSVIDCVERTPDIISAVKRALSLEFRDLAALRQSPFGSGYAAERICEVLKNFSLDGILKKRFYDI